MPANSACHSELNELPDTIGRLQALEQLLLEDNNLVNLPESMARLGMLSVLNVASNPLTSPPIEVAQQGAAAVLSYFKELEKNGLPGEK